MNHPTVPLGAIVANINMDGAHTLFPVQDIIALGAQHSRMSMKKSSSRRSSAEFLYVAADVFNSPST